MTNYHYHRTTPIWHSPEKTIHHFYTMTRGLKGLIVLLAMAILLPVGAIAQNRDEIKISKIRTNDQCDTLRVDFKILRNGNKLFRTDIFKKNVKDIFRVKETGVSEKYMPVVDSIIDISKQESRMDNIDIMLLIDHGETVTDELLERQREITDRIVNVYGEEARIFVSIMYNSSVSESVKVDSSTYQPSGTQRIIGHRELYGGGKLLYKSVLSKLQEMRAMPQTYFNVDNSPEFKSNDGRDKVIFVFTDGMIKDNDGEFYGGIEDYTSSFLDYLKSMDDGRYDIPVYCIYIGEDDKLSEENEERLSAFSKIGSGSSRGFFKKAFTPEQLQQLTMGVVDSVAPDYQLVLINPDGKRYDGTALNMMVFLLEGDDTVASGEQLYMAGSKESPTIVTHGGGGWLTLLLGLVVGSLILVLTYMVMQLLVPKIRYSIFLKKYVVPFSKSAFGVVEQNCFYCKEPIEEGELVVKKCEHIVHKDCWDENGGRCPEYGRHKCKTGIHYYNKEKLTDPKNATHLLPWIMAGFISGLLSWMLFFVISRAGFLEGTMYSLVNALNPWSDVVDDGMRETFALAMSTKTAAWLQKGIALGFFMTLLFSYVIEFRKVDSKIFGQIVLRSLVGGVVGMLAMLIGSIVVILTGKASTYGLVDWIPYLIFALAEATVIWFKTEIKLKSALIGGCISVLFSFLVIYLASGRFAPVIGYMLYAAGLGGSIAVVHYASEKYFLRIDGCVKERDIAIYKWMSVTGGFNKVSIGKSANCVLQMNWDKSDTIGDRVVELYLEKSRPTLRVLDNGVTRQGRSLPKDTVIPLTHGGEFTIGQTRFTYIEKDI